MVKNQLERGKSVQVHDTFWRPYMELVRDQVIPYQWEALNDRIPDASPSHAIENFRIAAGEAHGDFHGMVFQDSDVAKWLEAVAYSLETDPDAQLEQTADDVIDLLGRAQQTDGYLNTYFTIKEPENRWGSLMHNHELYCAGHFIEAAVAYYNTTGKRKFLDIMCRYADYIDTVFGEADSKLSGYPGHQEIELALVRLYRATNNDKYLKLSQFFINARGKRPHYFDVEREKNAPGVFENMVKEFDHFFEYNQSHKPVREQDKAVGHSVRAVYMYTAMADLAAETGDESLMKVSKALWENTTQRQMYLTGGLGSTAHGEAFSFDYDLPNDLCYTETCASVGLAFWARRMLALEMNGDYADVLERVIYNGTISGMDLDGQKFFYVNPLEVQPDAVKVRPEKGHITTERQNWFSCACCPPNLARLIASIGHYIYGSKKNTGYVHLYIGSEAELNIANQNVVLKQDSNYPWDGDIKLSVKPEQEAEFTIALRIPGWCRDATLTINGDRFDIGANIDKGYVYIKRHWEKNDLIELELPLTVERVKSHPKVRANIGKVALQRGPIVYCLEETDNGPNLPSILLPNNTILNTHFDPDLLGGVTVITGEALKLKDGEKEDRLYHASELGLSKINIKAVPYYAWCNRDKGEMLVWMTEK